MGVMVALVQMPCRSGLPSLVRGTAEVFVLAVTPFGWAASGITLTTARATTHTRSRWPIKRLLYLVGFFSNCPYIKSSTNSTHLNSNNCAFFSTCLYSGMLIFHGRENTLESSIVA